MILISHKFSHLDKMLIFHTSMRRQRCCSMKKRRVFTGEVERRTSRIGRRTTTSASEIPLLNLDLVGFSLQCLLDNILNFPLKQLMLKSLPSLPSSPPPLLKLKWPTGTGKPNTERSHGIHDSWMLTQEYLKGPGIWYQPFSLTVA